MGRVRLTDEQRAEIRTLYAEGGPRRWTQEALASLYGVSDTTIAYICNPEYRARKLATDRARRQCDPEFREAHKALCRAWHARNRQHRSEYERRLRASRRAAKVAAE